MNKKQPVRVWVLLTSLLALGLSLACNLSSRAPSGQPMATPNISGAVKATLTAIASARRHTPGPPTATPPHSTAHTAATPTLDAATATPLLVPVPTIMPATSVEVQRDEEVDPVTGVATWTEPSERSEIQIRIRRADGTPLDKNVEVYRQEADVSGNPTEGEKRNNHCDSFWSETDDDGILTCEVPPDTYILDFRAHGWPWKEQFANHTVVAGQRTVVLFDLSLLTVGVRYADGTPADKYVYVYQQEANVSGEPVEGEDVAYGDTGDDGLITFELTPGTYAIQVNNVAGYDTWGRFDHAVPGGGQYTVILTLGRLAVETWSPGGASATDVYVKVYTLATDSSGNSVLADSIADRYSDNTGRAVFDLTPGLYGVKIGNDIELVDIPVQPGQVTVVNQTGYTVTEP